MPKNPTLTPPISLTTLGWIRPETPEHRRPRATERGPEDPGVRLRAVGELVVADGHRVEPKAGEELQLRHRHERHAVRPERRVEVEVPLEHVANVDEERVGRGGLEASDDRGRFGQPSERAVEVPVLRADGVEVRVAVVDMQDRDQLGTGESWHGEQREDCERGERAADVADHWALLASAFDFSCTPAGRERAPANASPGARMVAAPRTLRAGHMG
jgi:hypothetical protein